jgi:hypothetical protein
VVAWNSPKITRIAKMNLTRVVEAVIGGTIILVAGVGVFAIIEIVDRMTDSPNIRSRVNRGSEKFLAERQTILQAAALRAAVFLSQFNRSRWRR